MKSIQPHEFIDLVHEIATDLVGAPLQEITSTDQDLALGFYKRGGLHWLVLSLKKGSVVAFVSAKKPFKSSAQKPVALFLNAHFLGKKLVSAVRQKDFGRVFILGFLDVQMPLGVEVQLLTHSPNVLVTAGQKTISWSKPKSLKAQVETGEAASTVRRTNSEIYGEWEASRNSKLRQDSPPSKEKLEAEFERRKEGLAKAISKLDEDILRIAEKPWRQAGEFLVSHQSLKAPAELLDCVDLGLGLAQNIENCFQKSREQEQKLESARARRKDLHDELERLSNLNPVAWSQERKLVPPRASPPRKKAEKVGRKFGTTSGLQVLVGRNAQENLQLLREAKAWDYWCHLRDYPGAYGLIRRDRNREIHREEFEEVARWVATQSKTSLHSIKDGDLFDVVIVEARFVRPIKGEKTGRVTYQNEKVFRVRFKNPIKRDTRLD